MFLVSRTLMALLIESARAEASDNSLEVMLPFESDLEKQMFVVSVLILLLFIPF